MLEIGGDAAAARAALLNAIVDRRLTRATNPIGLLIRGVLGDGARADRYLLSNQSVRIGNNRSFGEPSAVLPPGLHSALRDALREGRTLNDAWLAERGISSRAVTIARAEIAAEIRSTTTPLAEKLAADDPATYAARLEEILADLELPAFLGRERRLEHPMLRGMCVARLEAELGAQLHGSAAEGAAYDAEPLRNERP